MPGLPVRGDVQARPAVGERAPGEEVLAGERRPVQPVRRANSPAARGVAADQLQHQQGQQRTVHDEAGVALGVTAVRGVVVDAMGVGRQGAEAEEQGRVRLEP